MEYYPISQDTSCTKREKKAIDQQIPILFFSLSSGLLAVVAVEGEGIMVEGEAYHLLLRLLVAVPLAALRTMEHRVLEICGPGRLMRRQ